MAYLSEQHLMLLKAAPAAAALWWVVVQVQAEVAHQVDEGPSSFTIRGLHIIHSSAEAEQSIVGQGL